ncbi:MAG TPA: sugar phosphate isomerase/epimerase, partial [Gemmataceae bacterium]|nr:sugar phosphate isomerase/epimerase [Gemmataceae bacterium]
SLGALAQPRSPAHAAEPLPAEPFGYCLNTATIRGQKLSLVREIEIIARAGYQGIEPWVSEFDQHVKDGKSLKDLGKLVRDRGLVIADAIGFAEWIVDDDQRRRKGLEETKRVMGMLQEVGCKHLAAPPAGATNQPGLNLSKAAERYAALCKIGEAFGVAPAMEMWGFSKNINKLGEAVQVAMESGAANACVLPDVYHFYKGGSDPRGIRLLGKDTIGILHVNDYPDKDRAKIVDADRVYPGDGVAPLKQVFADLRAIGYRGMLSLEVFNRDYWQKDALAVAVTGLEKLRAAVHASVI